MRAWYCTCSPTQHTADQACLCWPLCRSRRIALHHQPGLACASAAARLRSAIRSLAESTIASFTLQPNIGSGVRLISSLRGVIGQAMKAESTIASFTLQFKRRPAV